MTLTKITLSLLTLLMLTACSRNKYEKVYFDSHNNKVSLSQGEKSFVDKFISKVEGRPGARGKCTNAHHALGEPDYDGNPRNQSTFFSLGCGGEAIFQFRDNGLVNVKGPDLYIFEIGPSIEPTDIFISEDSVEWVYVGQTAGGTSFIDIDGKVKNKIKYHFIKLVDLKTVCGGRGGTDGADIDAIAAIGSL